MAEPVSIVRTSARGVDCVHTGPGTPAGRYLRQFWQPVYHSVDLAPGRAVTIRIMSQDFTLYRGQSGQAHMVDARCPHRGTQLSAGWIEGDALRCFYHGWKFSPEGRCLEQPAEENAFCDKVAIAAYPVREYLGFIFAFLGDGAVPEFPRHPEFEHFDGMVEIDSYSRAREEAIEGAARPGIRRGELVLKEGMGLEIEPNACLGTVRVNIGAGVLVTSRGAEELNELPTRVRHVA